MRLSVIIPARDAAHDIGACLDALAPQLGDRTDVEVIVADASADGTADLVRRAAPWARLVACPQGSGFGELRAAGLSAATGEVVAFTDACCRPGPGWLVELRGAPWDRFAAVGGVVETAPRQSLVEWAAFLNEYAAHLAPRETGEATILPGNNVGFRRDALARAGLIGPPQFWKTFALWQLAACGARFWETPTLVVEHARSTHAASFAHHRYLHGRCFGATRVAGRRWQLRLARALTCPALPLLLTSRLVRTAGSNPRYRGVLWQSLPLNFLFHVAWAVGEFVGYTRGPGDACTRLA